ncbi:YcaO-like family protein [Microlunatus sp. Gsoil 973]|uniref:YcaO-like family protein n=1 Tax=Microlunatus sp. Gsoil 973 TaxID=2672569 RepID=UPI0018A869E2|nr:YcaO-like family protein [Microlunatus sp. Gsoil 973]
MPEKVADTDGLLARAVGWRSGCAAAATVVGRVPADPMINQYAAVTGPAQESSPAGGAALDPESARRAAIGELLERYASARCPLPIATAAEVGDRERILGHGAFTLHSPKQRAQHGFPYRDSYSRAELTKVHSLRDNTPVWVPANLVGTDPELGHLSTSNGLAAGPTTLTALLRATQELVERDALMITWLHRVAARRVPAPEVVREITDPINARVTVLDLTPDYSRHPVAMVAGTALLQGRPRHAAGLACRAGFPEAVEKALLEWAQGIAFAGVNAARAADQPADPPVSPEDFDDHAVFYTRRPDLWQQLPIWGGPVTSPPHRESGDDHRAQLAELVQGLEQYGIELFYRDLTTADLAGCGVRAARVLSPQLVPIHADHRWPHLGGTSSDLALRYPWAPAGSFPSPLPAPARMTDARPAPGFGDFWAASELSALTRHGFAERMAAYVPGLQQLDPWSRPRGGQPAPSLTGGFADLLARRRSVRRFADEPMTHDDLGVLLSVLSGPPTGRGYPAAGALYAARAVCLLFSADRRTGQVLQHDPTRHTLTLIGDCPGWPELADDLAGQDAESAPAAVIGLYADSTAVLAKYGERGGRFLLIEAGAALQALALAAAELGLAGYPVGGASDRRMLGLAGLAGLPAEYVVSYFVGWPTPNA